MGTRALIYTRISSDRDGTGLGVERQEQDCRSLADRLGAEVIAVYTDDDTSAYSGKNRPQYQQMLADLDHGAGDLVLAWHPDRLHRRPTELLAFIDLCRARHVDVHTVQAGAWDPSPTGRAVALTLAAWSEYESAHKSERIQRKHLELAMNGKPSGGGRRPYGFEDDRVTVRADEADIIRSLMKRALAGESLVALTRDLNERGVPTTTGGQWRTHVVKKLLCSARIAGWREHSPGSKHGSGTLGGPFVAPATWEPIVTREDVETLRTRLAQNRRSGPPRRYLLSGIMRCGRCGAAMVATKRSANRSHYVCLKQSDGSASGCGRTSVLTEPADAFIIDAVRAALADKDFLARLTRAEATDPDGALADRLARDEAALIELGNDRDDGLITRAEFVARRARVQDRLDHTRRALNRRGRLGALDGFTGPGADFDTAWDTASLDRKRAVLTAALESLTLTPATPGRNTFDPDRFDPQWRA